MDENMMDALQVQTEEEHAGDMERKHTTEREWNEPIVPKMMGKDYKKYFYMNDEGQDVRELAAKAEAAREDKDLNDFLIAQYEVEQERNIDHARDNNI